MSTRNSVTPRRFTNDDIRQVAVQHKVCVRPVLRQVTDQATGEVHKLVILCGSTRESLCPPCAQQAKRLRMQQCAEGWHLEEEPLPDEEPGDPSGPDDVDDQADEDDDDESSRRHRSTRRRSDVADLPKVPTEHRSVGQAFVTAEGKAYRPSMFVTVTLGSYGKVIGHRKHGKKVQGAGAPVDPSTYDYRRAALDAMHATKGFDRLIQNIRRCAGFKVQYFAAIEEQLRLAPHFHVAMRGAIPRKILRQVVKATYFSLWWPPHERPVYVHRTPVWDPESQSYRDPDTDIPLQTWDEALAVLDHPEARPAHVLRFGTQVDIKGIIAPSEDAKRAIRYMAKYLTKDLATTYTQPDPDADDDQAMSVDAAYEAHIDRLHAEVLYLPCSETCANWLRFGIQPNDPGPGLAPGMCPNKAHDRENLGLGGRRVQVSQHWSGKTLSQHRADRAEVVRQMLHESGIEPPDRDRFAADQLLPDGRRRFVWEDLPVDDADYADVVMAKVIESERWRREYDTAKARWDASRASPDEPVDSRSATKTDRPGSDRTRPQPAA